MDADHKAVLRRLDTILDLSHILQQNILSGLSYTGAIEKARVCSLKCCVFLAKQLMKGLITAAQKQRFWLNLERDITASIRTCTRFT